MGTTEIIQSWKDLDYYPGPEEYLCAIPPNPVGLVSAPPRMKTAITLSKPDCTMLPWTDAACCT